VRRAGCARNAQPGFDARLEPLMVPSAIAARRRDLELNEEGIVFEDIVASQDEVDAADPLPDRPAVVITHGDPFGEESAAWPSAQAEALWADLQDGLAAQLPRSRLIVAADSGHRIQVARPDLVADAIREVAAAAVATSARSGSAVERRGGAHPSPAGVRRATGDRDHADQVDEGLRAGGVHWFTSSGGGRGGVVRSPCQVNRGNRSVHSRPPTARCYTARLTATTERSRSGRPPERARDGASRAGKRRARRSLASRADGAR